MKRTFIYRIFFSGFICLIMAACNSGSENMSLLIAQRDSLMDLTRTQGDKIELFNKAVQTINTAVDSISELEGLLFMPTDPEGRYSKADAIKDLENYELVLKHQHDKIEELRAGLKLNESGEDLKGMVEVMQQQLRAKDAMIAQLRSQLEEKELDIARLRRTVASQQGQIARQEEEIGNLGRTITAKDKALVAQDKMLNQCYVIIASKDELQKKGILRKGKLVAEAMLNKSALMKVDIRLAKEFAFAAKRPQILTNMPPSSYRLTTGGKGHFVLNITNPTDFWSISSILVIQTD